MEKCMYCADGPEWKPVEPVSVEVVADNPEHERGSSVERFIAERPAPWMMVGYESVSVWIEGIESDGEGEETKTTGIRFPANFCPICGRKLEWK